MKWLPVRRCMDSTMNNSDNVAVWHLLWNMKDFTRYGSVVEEYAVILELKSHGWCTTSRSKPQRMDERHLWN
jgi:hypothetical protein